jgi:DUF1680 family protein
MLKLTRQLYGWQPDGALFDYYERAHLNHVMAAQNPATGGFTYMTPMMSGAARGYSQPGEEVFWCCVGSGMESHAKHGDSIFWRRRRHPVRQPHPLDDGLAGQGAERHARHRISVQA